MANAARSPRPLRFALDGQAPFLEVDREDGLDLLDWLGLGRTEFGAVEASTLRPLCRRRLWPEARNFARFAPSERSVRPGVARAREVATLRRLAVRLVDALEHASGALVHFG